MEGRSPPPPRCPPSRGARPRRPELLRVVRLAQPDERAGCFRIAPAAPFRCERRYLEATNVLETTFRTAGGTLVVTDLMPVASEEDKHRLLLPDHEILRVFRCTGGEVDIEMLCEPRPRFGPERPRIREAGRLGVRMETSAGLLVLRSDLPLALGDGAVHARVRLRAGDDCTSR